MGSGGSAVEAALDRVPGFKFRVSGFGFRVQGSVFKAERSGFGFRV